MFRVAVLLSILLPVSTSLYAQTCLPVSGTYSTGDGTDGNAATGSGPWTLTATASTFSYVTFTPSASFTFAQLEQLSATFTSNSGGSGGGAPRLSVAVDQNGNGTYEPYPGGDGNIVIFLGDSPAFTDTDVVLNGYSGVNLIGNNDAGRYDTSHLTGGSPATTYSSAVALAGGFEVLSVSMIEDTFGTFPDRNLTLNSINLCAEVADLTITKTFTGGTPTPGSTVTFEIVVTNSGPAATSGTVTVTDTPSSDLEITSMSGTGWSCTLGTLTCTRDDSLASGASFEPIVVEATVTPTASGNATNSASVSGGGDADAANNTGTGEFAVVNPIPTLDPRALLVLVALLGVVAVRKMVS